MSPLKLDNLIIYEENITHIDLDCNWRVGDNMVCGVIIWLTSPSHYPDEELGMIVDTPYCLKFTKEEDIEAIKYYYETIRRPSVIDLRELYDQSKVNLDNRNPWTVNNQVWS